MNDAIHRDKPSKSARKRELAALQALAEQMTALNERELADLGVAARLREALALVRPMRPSGARNRQLKHCVKFMDADALGAVRAYLGGRHSRDVATKQAFRQAEYWRDRLAAEGDGALQTLLDQHQDLDRQRLRQLSRDAAREIALGQPAGAGRRLFRFLHAALSGANQKN